MPAFTYRAADRSGAQKKGVVEASSAAAARAMLRDQGLLPLAVEAAGERRSIGSIQLPKLGRSGMSARELATATRQISTLVGSDIPVEEALRLAANQSETQRVSGILMEVRGAILDGRSFASALATHPKTFPEFYRASVAAGEASGKLTDVLGHLAHFVENRQANSAEIAARLALSRAAGDGVAGRDRAAAGLCHPRHRQCVRVARDRSAAADADADRDLGLPAGMGPVHPDRGTDRLIS